MRKAIAMLLVLLLLPGCVSTETETDLTDSESSNDELQGVNIVAKTLGREVDGTTTYDLLRESGNNSTLILWAAAGCNGCHQWTQMIRECIQNGTIPEDSNIVTVHRYPSFEKMSYVNSTYGNLSSEHYSPWPVLVPEEGDTAWEAATGERSEVPLTEAFNNPVTPTLQVLDSEGRLIWQSRTYHSDYSVMEEIVGVIA
tara:strand:- start:990 stop:1586 length:597 start_codon:yes stop_codon:yes gene_type:complete